MHRFVAVLALVGLAGLPGCSPGPRPSFKADAPDEATSTTPPRGATATTAAATGAAAGTGPTPGAPAATTTGPASATTTTGGPVTTTTTAKPTTTTRPTKTISVTSKPEGDGTTITVRGAGCAGSDYAAGLEVRPPSGKTFVGDGGPTLPDGTWQLQQHFGPSMAAGTYTFAASCFISKTGGIVFKYVSATYTLRR
jgi:hypothetical protein